MRRISAFFLCLLLATTVCCNVATARASNYLKMYGATLITGENRGEVELNWNVSAKTRITSIGISQIKLFDKDGKLVKTIYGSPSNGLVFSTGLSHYGIFAIPATAGKEYYTEITFFAENDSGRGTGSYTTNTAMAKK